MTTEERIAAIRERLAKAAAGPWPWSHTYQIADEHGDLRSHWCLHNPASEAQGSCIDAYLVTDATAARSFGDEPLDQTPNFALIANAPSDLAFLLSELDAAKKDAERMEWLERNAFGCYGPISANGTPQDAIARTLCGSHRAPTLREAIDAAKAAAGSLEGSDRNG